MKYLKEQKICLKLRTRYQYIDISLIKFSQSQLELIKIKLIQINLLDKNEIIVCARCLMC